ncbi:hypothetical protein GCM10009631_23530 [Corynebacterium glaucum]
MLRDGHAQHHGEDHAERRERDEVLHRIGDHFGDVLAGEKVLDLDGLSIAWVGRLHTDAVANPGGGDGDDAKNDEEPERLGQLVADLFDPAEHAALGAFVLLLLIVAFLVVAFCVFALCVVAFGVLTAAILGVVGGDFG